MDNMSVVFEICPSGEKISEVYMVMIKTCGMYWDGRH